MDDYGVLGDFYDAVLSDLPRRLAESDPTQEVLRDVSGRAWTALELWQRVSDLANGLAQLNLEAGSRIAAMLENGPEIIELYFAVPLAGHIFVPLNTAWRGVSLTHILSDSEPAVVVTTAGRSAVIEKALATAGIDASLTIVADASVKAHTTSDYEALFTAGSPPATSTSPQDLAMLLYTSGTTGPSKANMLTHRSCLWMGAAVSETVGYRAGQTVHSCLPLFHANALLCGLTGALMRGATFAVSPRFTASGFWHEVKEVRADHTAMVGSMIPLLLAQEPSTQDRDHNLKVAYCAPMPERVGEFETRFGLKCASTYGLTDANVVTVRPPDDSGVPSCGVAADDWELRLVDAEGNTVDQGSVGELWARPKIAGISSQGYWRNPYATVQLWRGLWANTGDLLRQDEAGRYHFVDRKKDAIRKGGENVSSAEVEEAILAFPGVREAAVFAVPSALSEDDVMVALVPQQEASLNFESLFEHAMRELPFYAVPRYIRLVTELPRTENHRVRKSELRSIGITPETWDAGPVTRRRSEALLSQNAPD